MRLKRIVKRAAVTVGRLLPRPGPQTRRVVLCYHSVHPKRPFYSTTPEVFERHIEWLTAHCRLTSFADLVMDAPGDRNGRPLAAKTFDDGYDDSDFSAGRCSRWAWSVGGSPGSGRFRCCFRAPATRSGLRRGFRPPAQAATGNGEGRERRVRLGCCERAVRKLPLQPLLGHAAVEIVPQCLPLTPILPVGPEQVPASD